MQALFKNKNVLVISMTILAGVWIALVLIFAKFDESDFCFWGGLSFGVVSFLISILATALVGAKFWNRTTAELAVFSFIPIFIYLFFSVILNTIYVAIRKGGNGKVLVTLNIVLIGLFLIAYLFFLLYPARVGVLSSTLEAKSVPHIDASAQLGGLLASVQDPEAHAKLLKLKETVDYSPSLSQPQAAASENMFMQKLFEIQNLTYQGTDSATLCNAIDQAEAIYRSRNAIMASIR